MVSTQQGKKATQYLRNFLSLNMFASSSEGLPPGAGAGVEISTGDPFTATFQVSE
jgi:hypothetical protein